MSGKTWLIVLGIVAVVSVALIILGGGDSRVGPSIILISVDTLRPDHLGCYGYGRDTSPGLDAFAKESLRFETCFAQAPNTRPSCSSILTGFLPHETKVFSNKYALPAGVNTAAELLRQHGYKTLAVVSNFVLTGDSGFEQGFDFYDDQMGEEELIRGIPERIAEHTTSAAVSLMRLNRKDGFFMWIHYQDPHGPYTPPPPYNEMFVDPRLEPVELEANDTVTGVGGIPSYQKLPGYSDYNHYVSQYDGEIRYLDEHFARLIQALKEMGIYDTALIIFTADHGEGMGERDYYFAHGEFIYNNLIRVPLIVKYGSDLKGVSRDAAQTLDIVPTMLDVAGIVPGQGYRGSSLLGEIPPGRTIFSERPGDYALIQDGLKLIRHTDQPALELYSMEGDPAETINLASDAEHASQAKIMAGELERVRKKDRLMGKVRSDQPRISKERAEKFKALGYVQ
ncbi:sulfatase [Candidatus Eisenbacteria bacterium]|uniref:Sulfatase n=1 Tax=Eiseniibacteriota bacterium TaxID=2212470 RepID=A0ABV6YMX6_UNCEI